MIEYQEVDLLDESKGYQRALSLDVIFIFLGDLTEVTCRGHDLSRKTGFTFRWTFNGLNGDSIRHRKS
jgi:hypothetical protein